MREGCCRFGLWRVQVVWSGTIVHRVRFTKSGTQSPVPAPFLQYVSGRQPDFSELISIAEQDNGPHQAIYLEVKGIPYGETRTYKDIAEATGTHPRFVGSAMRQNPTPIIIPCHRVVAQNGPGGFTPELSIKLDMLAMEQKTLARTHPKTENQTGSKHTNRSTEE